MSFVGKLFSGLFGTSGPSTRARRTREAEAGRQEAAAKTAADKAEAAQRAEARRRAARAFGRSATALTGGFGTSGAQVRKTTLGG